MKNTFDLRLENIKVSLPSGRDLFAVPNLTLSHGSHVLIQGESGRGKTTFLHLIAGLFLPNAGSIKLGSNAINSLTDNQRCDLRRSSIGVIFQKLNLIEHMTVEENVSLAYTRSRSDQSRVINDALLRVNLKDRNDERCSYLSLGEQQRVAVARVLAQNPEIILADEPTSSLDEKNSQFVLSALKDASKGKTLIVVSHDHRITNQFQRVIRFEDYAK